MLVDVQQEYGLADAAQGSLAVREALGPAGPAKRLQGTRRAAGGERWRADLHARHDAAMADWLAYQAARKAGETWQPDTAAPSAMPAAAPAMQRTRAKRARKKARIA